MGKDHEQRLKVAAERNRELETKYGGEFHEVFGAGRWPDGHNLGLMAVDYLEWSHLMGQAGKKPQHKASEKPATQKPKGAKKR